MNEQTDKMIREQHIPQVCQDYISVQVSKQFF